MLSTTIVKILYEKILTFQILGKENFIRFLNLKRENMINF